MVVPHPIPNGQRCIIQAGTNPSILLEVDGVVLATQVRNPNPFPMEITVKLKRFVSERDIRDAWRWYMKMWSCKHGKFEVCQECCDEADALELARDY